VCVSYISTYIPTSGCGSFIGRKNYTRTPLVARRVGTAAIISRPTDATRDGRKKYLIGILTQAGLGKIKTKKYFRLGIRRSIID